MVARREGTTITSLSTVSFSMSTMTTSSSDPHKHTKDAWDYKLDFSKQAKVQAKVQPTVVRPRRGSAFPAVRWVRIWV